MIYLVAHLFISLNLIFLFCSLPFSCDILFSCLVSSIEKGSGNEAELACLCLAGVLLTLGQDQLNIADYKRISDTLKKSSVKGRTGLARLRSPLCFGILAFMGCNDDVYVDVSQTYRNS